MTSLAPLSLPLQTQLYLGQSCLNQQRYHEAFQYFDIAARSGHPSALNMLGRAYERGWGVDRNTQHAARLFNQAHHGGEGWASFNLADLYLVGDGVPHDRARAYHLYIHAAQKGVLKALNMLGLLHEEGITGTADLQGASHFYTYAHKEGDHWASLNLARLALDKGLSSQAVPYLRAIAQSGFTDVIEAARTLIASHPTPQLHALFDACK